MAEQEIAIAGPSSAKISVQHHIICPLCPNTQGFTSHCQLLKHIADYHEIKITRSYMQFFNLEEFTAWRNQGNREVDYVCHKTKRNKNGEKIIIYICNRSDTRGNISKATKRKTKAGGTIKIKGVCPSRIEARIFANGQVSTEFIETHVGHEDELRIKRLKKSEELQIVEKLKEGVPNSRILDDARKIENKKLTRMNVLTLKDLTNIKAKYNIENLRHKDDMDNVCFITTCDKDSVSGEDSDRDSSLHVSEPTTSRMAYQEDVKYFMEELTQSNISTSPNYYEEKLSDDEFIEKFRMLDQEKRNKLKKYMVALIGSEGNISKKRKIE